MREERGRSEDLRTEIGREKMASNRLKFGKGKVRSETREEIKGRDRTRLLEV